MKWIHPLSRKCVAFFSFYYYKCTCACSNKDFVCIFPQRLTTYPFSWNKGMRWVVEEVVDVKYHFSDWFLRLNIHKEKSFYTYCHPHDSLPMSTNKGVLFYCSVINMQIVKHSKTFLTLLMRITTLCNKSPTHPTILQSHVEIFKFKNQCQYDIKRAFEFRNDGAREFTFPAFIRIRTARLS